MLNNEMVNPVKYSVSIGLLSLSVNLQPNPPNSKPRIVTGEEIKAAIRNVQIHPVNKNQIPQMREMR